MMSAVPRSEVVQANVMLRAARPNNCGFNRSRLFLREFLFDQPMQIRCYRRLIETLDDLV
jgi:hypothetical protein